MTAREEEAPDWFERFVEWMDRYGGRACLGVLACAAFGFTMAFVIARSESSAQVARASEERDAVAIRKHMAWLNGFSDFEKKKWPVTSYCHPATAPSGKCECEPAWATAEVTWPERMENGDIACHATK